MTSQTFSDETVKATTQWPGGSWGGVRGGEGGSRERGAASLFVCPLARLTGCLPKVATLHYDPQQLCMSAESRWGEKGLVPVEGAWRALI